MPGISEQKIGPPPVEIIEKASLFLDLDGTLIEFSETPDGVHFPKNLLPLLEKLEKNLCGRLAIVSGRSIPQLTEFGLEHFMLAGSHGLEIARAGQSILKPRRAPEMDNITQEIRSFAMRDERFLVETKPYSTALHFRRIPEAEADVLAFMQRFQSADGLSLQHGKMLIEIRPNHGDKGSAIRKLMQIEPFNQNKPLFLGDDITDEDGFKAVADLSGEGVFVGNGNTGSAVYRLQNVTHVHQWLTQAAEYLAKK